MERSGACQLIRRGLEAISVHLVIDGHGGDPTTLKNVDLIHDFLDRVPDQIGMTKIAPPQVYTYRGQKSDDWGVSGFVLIAESHITVHTFPTRSYMNVDVFSCREFSAEECLEFVKQWFGLPQVECCVLERGLEYLSTGEAYSGMVRERGGLRSPRDSD